jgi:protoporphyrinogen/coproporphyrinogen III oxidase
MRIVVVGGGIAGLAAAHRALGLGADVLVVEQAPAVGGKLRTARLPSGEPAEAGAEAFAVRDPQTGAPSAAADLVGELGLADRLVQPGVSRAAVAVGPGALEPIPGGTLFGIPSDPAAERPAANGGALLGAVDDVAVGRLVRDRLGGAVVDRFVDPMLGGVYAGRADELSLAATMPALAEACRDQPTLTGAVRAVLAARPTEQTPLFATLHDGLGWLPGRLADLIGAQRIWTGRPVRELRRAGDGRWRLTIGSTRDPETVTADGVVLAVPATPAGRLLAGLSTVDSGGLGLDYASVALVTLVLPEADLPELSGFLVPAGSGYTIKAATFLDRKWPHLRRPGQTLVRLSLGRYGETDVLRRPDADLAAVAVADLADLVGTPREPLEVAVHRWGGALPQYAPGHLDRVAALRAALPPDLAVAGAAYDGVGIPACVRSGRAAVERLTAAVGQSGS